MSIYRLDANVLFFVSAPLLFSLHFFFSFCFEAHVTGEHEFHDMCIFFFSFFSLFKFIFSDIYFFGARCIRRS